jgi:hypothetical protein
VNEDERAPGVTSSFGRHQPVTQISDYNGSYSDWIGISQSIKLE